MESDFFAFVGGRFQPCERLVASGQERMAWDQQEHCIRLLIFRDRIP